MTTPEQAPADQVREALQAASGMLIRHHQWHAQQRTPDPEHGFIPADEYADSSLYEQTAEAIDKIDKALELPALSAPVSPVQGVAWSALRTIAAADPGKASQQSLAHEMAAIAAQALSQPTPGDGERGAVVEPVSEALKVLRGTSAHEPRDADEMGQSITASNAADALQAHWLRVQFLWRALAFPSGPEHAGQMADEMDTLLAIRPGDHLASDAGERS